MATVRSFTVKATKEALVQNIGTYLDEKLRDLQSNGWEIISVTPFNYKGWDYPHQFDATGFVILAKYE